MFCILASPAAAQGPRDSTELNAALSARLDTLGETTLSAVYGDDPEALWVSGGTLSPRGEKAWAELAAAPQRGLPSGRYGMRRLERLRDRPDRHVSTLAALDTDITRALLRLADDVARGVLPNEGYDPAWHLDSRDAVRLHPADSVRTSPARILAELDRVTPTAEQYHRLVPLLQRLRALEESGGWTPLPPLDGIVQEGDSAEIVRDLRQRLRQSLSARERRLARQGGTGIHFDSALARSVEHFQARHGIAIDGILGPNTHRELNTPVGDRIAAVRVALERWRWLPATLGSRRLESRPAVLVNTAGRRVHILEGGRPVLSMKVIIGQRDWKTALFQDAMERMVINPYWNVPESILVEETLPKAAEDPDYLSRNDFQVLDSDGEVVPLGSVEWREVDPASFPHRIRQLPGARNAMGRVKFLFPNRWAIYLHDTPADQLFDTRIRTFSHGCIRVEHPTEMAHYLLETATELPPQRYGEMKRSEERHVVELDEEIPTYLIYQTVWVDEEGIPTFTPDVYSRDPAVRDALSRLDDEGFEHFARREARGTR